MRELINKKGASAAGAAGCPGRAECKRYDAFELCKGCEFEKQSWGRWPETLNWEHVTPEAKTKYGGLDAFSKEGQGVARADAAASQLETDRWIFHLFWLYRKKEAGCLFRLDDLTPHEWDGLEIVCEEVKRITPSL